MGVNIMEDERNRIALLQEKMYSVMLALSYTTQIFPGFGGTHFMVQKLDFLFTLAIKDTVLRDFWGVFFWQDI